MIITNVWNDAPIAGVVPPASFITSGGYAEIFFTGSAYSKSGSAVIGANLLIDGNIVATAKVFTNEQSSHKSLVPISLVIKLAAGSHTAAISNATPQTQMDQNDFFTLTVTELSFS